MEELRVIGITILVASGILFFPACIVYGIIEFHANCNKFDNAYNLWSRGLELKSEGKITNAELKKLKQEVDKYSDPWR